MDTSRSEKKAMEFLNRDVKLKKKTQHTQRTFRASPSEVFHQFCPSRELDWIDGWECDLVHTSTGYIEQDCIFTTPETNLLGPGLWIVTRYEPNRELRIVRTLGDMAVLNFRIDLVDNRDGTCTGRWTLTFTAIREEGNAFIDALPDRNAELERAIDGLEHFLRTGTLLAAATA
jgi:hypothetical protein